MDSLYGKIPRDRLTLNAWVRSFHSLNRIVHNAVLFHATCSISRFRIVPQDSRCWDAIRTLELAEPTESAGDEWLRPGANLLALSKEYWKLGEAFPHLEFDDAQQRWSKLTILNPDYMYVRRTLAGDRSLQLRPDEVLRKIATSTNPADEELRRSIPAHVLSCIEKDEYIPLDERYTSHIWCAEDPYDIRGTSMVTSVIRDLLMYDALRDRAEVDIEQLEKIEDSIRAGLLFSPKLLGLVKERHAAFRTLVSRWMTGKLFAPLRVGATLVPTVVWKPMDDHEMFEILSGG
jgi:hypothetical protein